MSQNCVLALIRFALEEVTSSLVLSDANPWQID